MAGNDNDIITHFRGTREEVNNFLDRQPTSENHWVVRNSNGVIIHLT